MLRVLLAAMIAALSLGGCPIGSSGSLTAAITANVTQGPPPLNVLFSAAASNGPDEIVSYDWDFAGLAGADTLTAEYTFASPGGYAVTLTVVDAAGRSASARTTIRVEGGPVTAVIEASVSSGPAPLSIAFDGRSSTAEEDVVHDYYWDFGDGTSARTAAPVHTYSQAGEFVVTLRAVSAGGVEGTATTTITVSEGSANGSLQFDGSQFATLPVSSAALSAFTFEAWCRPDSAGGSIATFGNPPLDIRVNPGTSRVSLVASGTTVEGLATDLEDRWVHVALAFEAGGALMIVVDGELAASASAGVAPPIDEIVLGNGYSGNLADVRFWSVARTVDQIADNLDRTPAASADQLGLWALDEGNGQVVGNEVGEDGVLGSTSAVESTDPAWSADRP